MTVFVIGKVIAPNVFSPNGDGIHDRWVIQGMEGHPDATVEIFNRYGQSLYRRKGYSTATAWDGSMNGKPLPVGTYFYVIQGLNNQPSLSGSITLLR
jgi:gliding motility-associated-like protein